MNKYLKEIMNYVIDQTGLDIRENTRRREYVYARSLYFKLAREFTAISMRDIAESVDRDHATVIHSINNVFPLACSFNPRIRLEYERYVNFKSTGQLSPDNIDYCDALDSLKIENDRLRITNNEVLNLINTVDEYHYPVLLERVKSIVKMLNLTPIVKTKEKREMEGAEL